MANEKCVVCGEKISHFAQALTNVCSEKCELSLIFNAYKIPKELLDKK